MARPLHVALIGQKFMGKAHSNAWGQANRFFDLPRPVHLDTLLDGKPIRLSHDGSKVKREKRPATEADDG